ncbi:hypothetical protein [Posidoniimonas polymericola]|nr:hypothetical protein [Posidoniimonas polymericola]
MAARSLRLTVLTALLLPLAAAPAGAQDTADAYARGVNAYFNGSANQAEGWLDQAAGARPNDPLVYYYRGLAKHRQGRRYEAEADFQIGAAIEARRAAGTLGIGHALQRIQGGERLLLERIRREAREAFQATTKEDRRSRYQPASQPGKRAMRAEFRLPLGMLSSDASPDAIAQLVAEQAESSGDPFADEPVSEETAAAAPMTDDLAAEAPAPSQPAATPTPIDVPDAARGAVSTKQLGGLFGGMIKGLLPKPPASAGGFGAPPAGGNDPFGDAGDQAPFGGEPLPADDDPFGAPPAGDDPFGAPPAEDDPFGAAEPMPADENATPPAGAPSEPAAEDPFGGGDDPFGGGDDPFAGEDPFS